MLTKGHSLESAEGKVANLGVKLSGTCDLSEDLGSGSCCLLNRRPCFTVHLMSSDVQL